MRSAAALFCGLLIGMMLGSVITAVRFRADAIEHGAAEWQVHTAKDGHPYKAFVWSSHE